LPFIRREKERAQTSALEALHLPHAKRGQVVRQSLANYRMTRRKARDEQWRPIGDEACRWGLSFSSVKPLIKKTPNLKLILIALIQASNHLENQIEAPSPKLILPNPSHQNKVT
jgi:hypothetical protein